MFKVILGSVAILLSVWQFVMTFKEYNRVRTSGNKNTSAFSGYSIYYSGFFGFILLVLGIGLFL